jgi:hypothetical protein
MPWNRPDRLSNRFFPALIDLVANVSGPLSMARFRVKKQ